MMTLKVGWEDKLIELSTGRKKREYAVGEGKPVKNRIKAIYKMIEAGEAVVADQQESEVCCEN